MKPNDALKFPHMHLKSTYQFKSQLSLIPCVKSLHRLHETVMTNDRRLTFTPVVEEEENTHLGQHAHAHTHTQAKPVCVRAQVKRIVYSCSK